jgi:hypothetical protein
MKISEIAATLTGESMMSKNTSGGEHAPSDEIARLAYCLYEARGRRDGHDVDDWLEAERGLTDSFRGPERSTALTGVQL